MNTLIIFAHPNHASLNGRLMNRSVRILREMNHQVEVSDLYGQNFQAAAGPGDFTRLVNPEYFDLQKEQAYAAVHGTFTPDITAEQKKLLQADLLLFHFPFWWYSMPAVMKGYFDRVFSVGFAYGGAEKLAGKKAIVCTTTGAGTDWLNDQQPPGNIQRIFHHILYGTFAFTGMHALEPFVVYHAKRLNEEQRLAKLEEWEVTLQQIEDRKRIF